MNKIEQLHFEVISEAEFSNYSGHSEGQETAAIKSAEITEQIAVEFADFYVSYCNKHGQTHSEEVFEEYLKTKQ